MVPDRVREKASLVGHGKGKLPDQVRERASLVGRGKSEEPN